MGLASRQRAFGEPSTHSDSVAGLPAVIGAGGADTLPPVVHSRGPSGRVALLDLSLVAIPRQNQR